MAVTAAQLLQEKRDNMCNYLMAYATEDSLKSQLNALRMMPIEVFVTILLQNIKPKEDKLDDVVNDMTKNINLEPFLDNINVERKKNKQVLHTVETATAEIKELVLSYMQCFLCLASSASLVL